MAKSQQTYNKSEKEKKRLKKREEKAKKKLLENWILLRTVLREFRLHM